MRIRISKERQPAVYMKLDLHRKPLGYAYCFFGEDDGVTATITFKDSEKQVFDLPKEGEGVGGVDAFVVKTIVFKSKEGEEFLTVSSDNLGYIAIEQK